MSKKKTVKRKKSSIELAAQSGAASEVVDRYGSAVKEHYVAYSGLDNENGRELTKGLKKVSQSKINPDTRYQNIKQQAGYAAEIKYTARQNTEKIIKKEDTRYSRTDDLGSVNDPLFDHKQIDLFGNEIAGTGEQMKFKGRSPKDCLTQLASPKNEKYLDANATITVPSDYYDGIIAEADKELESLYQQLKYAEDNGNTELVDSIKKRIAKYQKIRSSVKNSGISNKEAIEARLHPKISTAKDIARVSHRAGVEQAKWGAGIAGGISLIRNVVAVAKGEKEPSEAASSIVKDTSAGAVTAYTTAFAGSALKGTMQNSSSQYIRSISKTNAPAAMVMSTIDVGKTMVKFVKGDISGVECLEEIGEKGTSHLSAAMFAAVGQIAIPIPVVGAMVGSMVGYALSASFYKELTQSLKEAKIAREERIRIEKECQEARAMIAEYRILMQQTIKQYLESHIMVFNEALSGIDEAMLTGDIDLFLKSSASIQTKLGYTPEFSNMSEFQSMMESDKPFNL